MNISSLRGYLRFGLLVGIIFVFSPFLIGSQKENLILGNVPDEVIMIIDGDSIWLSDFAYIYKKNSEGTVDSNKTFDDYVELFKIFKLKVHEAQMQGIDTTQSFNREFRSYRSQATIKYMRDEETLDSLISVGYDRMKRDRSVSHIAVACPNNASDSVKQQAWNKITEIQKLAMENKDGFNQLALDKSEDPNVKQNSGKLGWVRPYRYVYNFEEAVYNTPVGEISNIFRTPFGYHIVKVEKEIKHLEVRVQHIMKIFNKEDEASIAESKKKIDSIYALLLKNNDFSEIAQKESDDKGSASKGGDLGWFGRGMMVRTFEDVAYKTKINELSKPFESEYGWHVLYKMGQRGILPLDSLKKQILNSIERDDRMKIADSSFIRKMRAFYKLSDTLSNSEVRKYVDEHLEERYEDLRHIVKEYHDGIMLFEISLKEVWNKASMDTVGLQKYFEANRKKYLWDAPKYKGFVIQCVDERNANLVNKIFKNNFSRSPDSMISYINSILNVDSVPFVKITKGVWAKGENSLVDRDIFSVKDAKVTPSKNYPIVFVKGKKIKSPEDYKDVRTEVISDYQDILEKNWIDELKKKYPIQINRSVLEKYKKYIGK